MPTNSMKIDVTEKSEDAAAGTNTSRPGDSRSSEDSRVDLQRLFSVASTGGIEEHTDIQKMAHKTNLTVLQAKLILVVALPIIGLIGIASKAIDTARNQSLIAQKGSDSLNFVIELDRLVRGLQLERGASCSFLVSGGINDALVRLTFYRNSVDRSLVDLTPWPSQLFINDRFFSNRYLFQQHLFISRAKVNNQSIEFSDIIQNFSDLIYGIMSVSQSSLVIPDQGVVWAMAIAFHSILRSLDFVGIQRSIGEISLLTCNISLDTLSFFRQLEGRSDVLLTLSFVYQSSLLKQYRDQYAATGLQKTIEADKKVFLTSEFYKQCANWTEAYRLTMTEQWRNDIQNYEAILENMERTLENQTLTTISEVRFQNIMSTIYFSVKR